MASSTIASLRILLGLDSGSVRPGTTAVNRDLQTVQRQAAATNTSLAQVGSGLRAGVGLGGGLLAFNLAADAARNLVGFLTDGVKAAQEDEASTIRLTAAIVANGAARADQAAIVETAIRAGQRLGFTDDAVRGSLTRLVAATHDLKAATDLQNTAMDLARFKGVDLATATEALTAIEAGRFRGLAQLGIVLEKGATQAEAIAAVQAVAAGQAKAFGETSAGAAEQAGIAMEEAGESIGRSLLPIFKELSHFARDVVAPALTIVGDNMGLIITVAEVLGTALLVKVVGGFAASAVAAVASSATQVGAIGAVTVAFDAMKISAIGAWLASLGPAALLAGSGVAFIKLIELTKDTDAAQKASAISAGDLTGAQAALLAQARAGTIGWDEYDQKLDAVRHQQELQARSAVIAAGGTNAMADAAGKAAIANDVGATAAERAALATAQAGAASTAAAGASGASAAASVVASAASGEVTAAQLRVAQATLDAAAAHDDLSDALKAATDSTTAGAVATANLAAAQVADRAAADELQAAQEALSAETATLTSRYFDLVTQQYVNVTAAGTLNGKMDDSTTAALVNDAAIRGLTDAWKGLAVAQAGVGGAGEGIVRTPVTVEGTIKFPPVKVDTGDARRRAEEIAAAYRDRLGDAFEAVRRSAHQFFDALHQRNLDAIADAQRMADEQIAAQKRANLENVTAAEAAFKAVQDQRQLANLQASVASAEDPTQKLAAQQALNDFLTRQRIDAMRGIATAANDQLDAQKAANDKLAAGAIAAENDRAAAQTQAFDFGLAALEKSLSEQPKAWSTTQQQVMKLLMSFGVDYQKAGEAFGERFAAGLLSTTRLAEDAAKALALAAGSPLGVAPGAAVAPTTSPAVAGITPASQQPLHIHVYLEGEQILDYVDDGLARRGSRVTSGGIAG